MTKPFDLQKYTPPEGSQPWSNGWWDGKLTVAFSHATAGWIQMALLTTTWTKGVIIHCSEPWSPFREMVKWLNNIADRRFPTVWDVYEEGWKRLLIVHAYDEDKVDLQVWGEETDCENPPPPKFYFRTRLDRIQLLHEFHRKFAQYVREDFDISEWSPPDPWGYNSQEDLTTFGLSRVVNEIEKFPKIEPPKLPGKNLRGARRKDSPPM